MTEGAAADQAIVAAARGTVGVDEDEPVAAWPVRRLRDPQRPYVLVVFGSPSASTGVATVDPSSHEVLEWARLQGREAHLPVDARAARLRAGLGDEAEAALVWEAGSISRSPLYPFWEVRRGSEVAWVDGQRGDLFTSLGQPGHGGGPPGNGGVAEWYG